MNRKVEAATRNAKATRKPPKFAADESSFLRKLRANRLILTKNAGRILVYAIEPRSKCDCTPRQLDTFPATARL